MEMQHHLLIQILLKYQKPHLKQPILFRQKTPVTISGVTKGQKGAAGELRGYFSSNQAIGNLFINSDEGVYGQLDVSPVEQQALPVAMKQEVKEGPAQI